MRRLVFVILVGIVAAVAAPALTAPGRASRAASCTYEQKQARTKALAQYLHGMEPARKSYFARVKDTRKRATFVRAQQQKLRTLRAAASCRVPPLPASSSASCSLQLAQHPWGPGNLSEGPIAPGWTEPAVGRIDSVILFLDYPDAPGQGDPATLATSLAGSQSWFDEVSYGRLTFNVTAAPRWIRMPAPTSAYIPLDC